MRIHGQHPPTTWHLTDAGARPATAERAGRPALRVDLSPRAHELADRGAPPDPSRVERLQRALAEARLVVDPRAIADRLVRRDE